jgi:serine phosphatase
MGEITMELMENVLTAGEAPKLKLTAGIRKYQNIILLAGLSVLIARFNCLGGLSPLILPFVLACQSNLFIFAGAITGLLLTPEINCFKYALMIFCAVLVDKFISMTFPKLEKRKYRPYLIFAVSFLFSWIFIMFTNFTPYDILLTVFEAFISAVFYLIYKKGMPVFTTLSKKRFFTSEDTAAAAIMVTCAIAGIGNLAFPFSIYIKNVIGVLAVLLFSMFGNFGMASQAAVLMGLATGISSNNMGIFLATYVLNGLCCSIFSKYGKLTCILGFTIGNIITSIFLVEERLMVIGFPEIAIASVLFVLIPDKFFDRMFKNVQNASSEYDKAAIIKDIATVKLDRLGLAFRKLSDTILSAMNKTKPANLNDMGALFDAVADKVCKKCALRSYCWQKDYTETMDAMFKAAKKIEETGSAGIEDFPPYFSKKCVKADEVLHSLTNLYEIYRVNTIWQNKMMENTSIYRDQFIEISNIVGNLKEEILSNPYFDAQLTLELSSELERNSIDVKKVNVIKNFNNQYEVEIRLYPCQEETPCFELISKVLKDMFHIPFYKDKGKCSHKECVLLFKECEIFHLSTHVRQANKDGNEKSGDSYCCKNLDNGNFFLALCDGSGSGDKANAYSSATVKLLEQFLKTGFSKDATLKLINTSMLIKTETDYFSTIDFGLIDLKNGTAEFMKKGAAPTYIRRRDGSCEVISVDNLPAGIINSGNEQAKQLKLREGDMIIMVSDGICDAVNKEHWVIDALNAVNLSTPEDISEIILKIAQSSKNAKDDMTIMVSEVMMNA